MSQHHRLLLILYYYYTLQVHDTVVLLLYTAALVCYPGWSFKRLLSRDEKEKNCRKHPDRFRAAKLKHITTVTVTADRAGKQGSTTGRTALPRRRRLAATRRYREATLARTANLSAEPLTSTDRERGMIQKNEAQQQ